MCKSGEHLWKVHRRPFFLRFWFRIRISNNTPLLRPLYLTADCLTTDARCPHEELPAAQVFVNADMLRVEGIACFCTSHLERGSYDERHSRSRGLQR